MWAVKDTPDTLWAHIGRKKRWSKGSSGGCGQRLRGWVHRAAALPPLACPRSLLFQTERPMCELGVGRTALD